MAGRPIRSDPAFRGPEARLRAARAAGIGDRQVNIIETADPDATLAEVLERTKGMGEEAGLRVANVFHAGDGNLHPLILFDGRQPGAVERAEELAADILALCVDQKPKGR